MRKIAVWRAVGSAYGFAFDKFASITGLVWPPLAALQTHRLRAWLLYLCSAWFLVQPLALGLTVGAAAAYRALVPPAPAVSTRPAESPLPAS